jgi:hypothetical protein
LLFELLLLDPLLSDLCSTLLPLLLARRLFKRLARAVFVLGVTTAVGEETERVQLELDIVLTFDEDAA